ncbi:MAG: hypothetical protein SGPRY_001585 [Prymnesium sp.]
MFAAAIDRALDLISLGWWHALAVCAFVSSSQSLVLDVLWGYLAAEVAPPSQRGANTSVINWVSSGTTVLVAALNGLFSANRIFDAQDVLFRSISFPAKQKSMRKEAMDALTAEDAPLPRTGVSVKDAVGVEDLHTILKWDRFSMLTMLHWLLRLIGSVNWSALLHTNIYTVKQMPPSMLFGLCEWIGVLAVQLLVDRHWPSALQWFCVGKHVKLLHTSGGPALVLTLVVCVKRYGTYKYPNKAGGRMAGSAQDDLYADLYADLTDVTPQLPSAFSLKKQIEVPRSGALREMRACSLSTHNGSRGPQDEIRESAALAQRSLALQQEFNSRKERVMDLTKRANAIFRRGQVGLQEIVQNWFRQTDICAMQWVHRSAMTDKKSTFPPRTIVNVRRFCHHEDRRRYVEIKVAMVTSVLQTEGKQLTHFKETRTAGIRV